MINRKDALIFISGNYLTEPFSEAVMSMTDEEMVQWVDEHKCEFVEDLPAVQVVNLILSQTRDLTVFMATREQA